MIDCRASGNGLVRIIALDRTEAEKAFQPIFNEIQPAHAAVENDGVYARRLSELVRRLGEHIENRCDNSGILCRIGAGIIIKCVCFPEQRPQAGFKFRQRHRVGTVIAVRHFTAPIKVGIRRHELFAGTPFCHALTDVLFQLLCVMHQAAHELLLVVRDAGNKGCTLHAVIIQIFLIQLLCQCAVKRISGNGAVAIDGDGLNIK